MRAPREGIPPAVWRIAGEVAFLVAAAVAVGVARLSWWVILVAMAGAFAVVCAIEWLAGREPLTFAHSAEPAPAHPVVEAQRAEDTEEHESLGWTAFEEAQEPSDAMTMIADGPREADKVEEALEPEPEVDQPPPEEPEQELPHHVRVLPQATADDEGDPWEQGFDGPADADTEEPGEPDEATEEPAASVPEPARRRFRRR
jgi:hypothetical protein